jgi:hypothetical protein
MLPKLPPNQTLVLHAFPGCLPSDKRAVTGLLRNKEEKTNPRYTNPQRQIQIFNLKLSKFIHGENSNRIPSELF